MTMAWHKTLPERFFHYALEAASDARKSAEALPDSRKGAYGGARLTAELTWSHSTALELNN